MENAPGGRRAPRLRFLLIFVFLGAAGGLALSLISLRMNDWYSLVFAGLGLMLSLGSLQAGLRWWKQADEAVKEAHKTGWYWGGSYGLGAAAGVLGVMFSLDASISLRQFALFPGDAGLVATGLLIAIGFALFGYLIAWAAWWAHYR